MRSTGTSIIGISLLIGMASMAAGGYATKKCKGDKAEEVQPEPQQAAKNSKKLQKVTVRFRCDKGGMIAECSAESRSMPVAAGDTKSVLLAIKGEPWYFDLACSKDKAPSLTGGRVLSEAERDQADVASSPYSFSICQSYTTVVSEPVKGFVQAETLDITLKCNEFRQITHCLPARSMTDAPDSNNGWHSTNEVEADASKQPSQRVFFGMLEPSHVRIRFKLACGRWTKPEVIYAPE